MDLSGVLVVDKPGGITSYDVIRKLNRKIKKLKIGHTGTLDPFATGVLPLCLGKATRLSRFFTKTVKGYRGVISLGTSTDSHDYTGKVTSEREVPGIPEELLRETFASFEGEVEMLPPMYSAKKIDGERLYKLAREGKDLEVTVHDIPEEQDQEIAAIKLETLDAGLDVLTADQIAYNDDYAAGT